MEARHAAKGAASEPGADHDDARAGEIVRFPKPKRPRGRPRKAAKTPSRDDFDIVRAAIKGVPKGRRLAAAKAEARRIVGADTRSSATAIALFDRIVDAMNHAEGCDWHSVRFYAGAEQCDKPKRSIERAMRELIDNGHIVRRRRQTSSGGWDISETTSPTLARAGNATIDLGPEAADLPGQDDHTDEETAIPADEKTGGDTDEKCKPYRQTNTDPTDHYGGLISKKNLQENLIARERARDDFSDLDLFEDQTPAAPARPPAPTPAVEPRFDRKLPLRQRIDLFRFGEPATEEGQRLKRALLRAAKDWDRQALKDGYCGWMEREKRAAPHDAMEAFIGWVHATAVRRERA